MVEIFLNILYHCFLYPLCVVLRLFGKVYISNQYKAKNSYWFKYYGKNNNIPDTNYTLW